MDRKERCGLCNRYKDLLSDVKLNHLSSQIDNLSAIRYIASNLRDEIASKLSNNLTISGEMNNIKNQHIELNDSIEQNSMKIKKMACKANEG